MEMHRILDNWGALYKPCDKLRVVAACYRSCSLMLALRKRRTKVEECINRFGNVPKTVKQTRGKPRIFSNPNILHMLETAL